MKALVLCSSDVLGVPAIIHLHQQKKLHGVAIPERAKHILVPILKQFGIPDVDIHILNKPHLTIQLKELIQRYQPEALFTLTFSWMVPSEILKLLPNKCINFHFGLLPKYKGADPIFWQLYNNEGKGGISIHIMTNELDAGPLLRIEELPIIQGETYGLHAQRLGQLAAQSVIKVLDMLASGAINTINNEEHTALYLKKPEQTQLTISWQQQTALQVECLVNAANPRYNGALTSIRQIPVHILEVSLVNVNNPSPVDPGTIVYADSNYGLIVACINQQYLKINIVQTQQGFLSGIKLFNIGFQLGDIFI